jgi:hypothetical protein
MFQTRPPSRQRQFRRSCVKGSSPDFSRQRQTGAVEQSYAHAPFVKTLLPLCGLIFIAHGLDW